MERYPADLSRAIDFGSESVPTRPRGLHSGGLLSWATDFGSGSVPTLWGSTLWRLHCCPESVGSHCDTYVNFVVMERYPADLSRATDFRSGSVPTRSVDLHSGF